jgi:hypothetical protein
MATVSITAKAESAAPKVRIVDAIDETHLVALKGNTHPAATAKNDVGKVSDTLRMSDLILVLSRDPTSRRHLRSSWPASMTRTRRIFTSGSGPTKWARISALRRRTLRPLRTG